MSQTWDIFLEKLKDFRSPDFSGFKDQVDKTCGYWAMRHRRAERTSETTRVATKKGRGWEIKQVKRHQATNFLFETGQLTEKMVFFLRQFWTQRTQHNLGIQPLLIHPERFSTLTCLYLLLCKDTACIGHKGCSKKSTFTNSQISQSYGS